MAKNTEYRKAVEAIDTALNLKHYRTETAHRAIGAALAYMGARRLRLACDEGSDQEIVTALAEAEDAAIRLDAIPQKTERGKDRAVVWTEITVSLQFVKGMFAAEHKAPSAARGAA